MARDVPVAPGRPKRQRADATSARVRISFEDPSRDDFEIEVTSEEAAEFARLGRMVRAMPGDSQHRGARRP